MVTRTALVAERRRSRRVVGDFLDSYRVRLVLAFALVGDRGAGLVLTTLPRLPRRLLQAAGQESLQTRADSVVQLVGGQLQLYQTIDSINAHPILMPQTIVASDTTDGRSATRSGFRAEDHATRSPRRTSVDHDRRDEDDRSRRTRSRCPPPELATSIGQQREPIGASSQVQINDRYYSASAPVGPSA